MVGERMMGASWNLPMLYAAFRRSFYGCVRCRGDALFELTDAILSADGAASSAAHLSLTGVASSWLGESLRRLGSRADRRRSPAKALSPVVQLALGRRG